MRRQILAAIIIALTATASAIAQPNPVLAHFTAYRTALEAGDLATAEREAALALAASEQSQGDGGRTAVLALNLALTRLQRGDASGALQPAQRSLALARAGAAGVDPNLAELVVGRAELRVQGAQRPQGASRIATVLEGPNVAALPVSELYSAAVDLAVWREYEGAFPLARRAWAIAAEYATGSPFGPAYGRGRARIGEAAALIRSQIGANGARRISNASKQEIYDLLTEAISELGPLANIDSPTGVLTIAQRAYAEALAWRNAIYVKLRAQGDRPPRAADAEGDEMSELGPLPLTTPRCQIERVSGRVPTYPRDMLNRDQMAVVVLRIRLDETGGVTEAITAARIGNADFSAIVEPIARTWRFAKLASEPAGCRMPTTVLLPVNFIIG